jgi:hypothetical protein
MEKFPIHFCLVYISKFQMWFIAKGWYECKVEIEIKKEVTKASHS